MVHPGGFSGEDIEKVQQSFFLERLPDDRKGRYRYLKKGLNATQGTMVLFQYDNHIIAAARLEKVEPYDKPDSQGYRGALAFVQSSIRVFKPVSLRQIQDIWPKVKRFSQSQWILGADKYSAFQKILKQVRSPYRLDPEEAAPENDDSYKPDSVDRRKIVQRQIAERRGQQKFRNALRQRYGDICLVTGSKILDIIEAAHIAPYRGDKDNDETNGLLLRADIHTLFDLDLLGIEPDTLRIELHPRAQAEYSKIVGLTLGCSKTKRPSADALKIRYAKFTEGLEED